MKYRLGRNRPAARVLSRAPEGSRRGISVSLYGHDEPSGPNPAPIFVAILGRLHAFIQGLIYSPSLMAALLQHIDIERAAASA